MTLNSILVSTERQTSTGICLLHCFTRLCDLYLTSPYLVMNCRGPPKNVYKNNRIQKLALPSIQSENIRDGQALSKHKLIKAVIDQVHNKVRTIPFRSLVGFHLWDRSWFGTFFHREMLEVRTRIQRRPKKLSYPVHTTKTFKLRKTLLQLVLQLILFLEWWISLYTWNICF